MDPAVVVITESDVLETLQKMDSSDPVFHAIIMRFTPFIHDIRLTEFPPNTWHAQHAAACGTCGGEIHVGERAGHLPHGCLAHIHHVKCLVMMENWTDPTDIDCCLGRFTLNSPCR